MRELGTRSDVEAQGSESGKRERLADDAPQEGYATNRSVPSWHAMKQLQSDVVPLSEIITSTKVQTTCSFQQYIFYPLMPDLPPKT